MSSPESPHHLSPVSGAELQRFVGMEIPGPVIDETILQGNGVSEAFIANSRQVSERFSGYKNRLDYHTFPRDRQAITYRFFQGELFGEYSSGKRNEVNNPLGIIRPYVLSSPGRMVTYGIDEHYSIPINSASAEARGYNDDAIEALYARLVLSYEKLFVTALESVNMDNETARAAHVDTQLRSIFMGPEKVSHLSRVPNMPPSESAAGWLAHVALAVLLHPSEEITPAGRVRALSLLKLYPPDELGASFGKNVRDETSYDRSGLPASDIRQRIPFTMQRPQERHLDEHEEWERHPDIAPIVGQIKAGDYREASNNIVSRPLEAVQLAVLSLSIYGKSTFGLSLLQQLPNLGSKTLALMFGSRATFYKDHAISNRLEDQVAEGTGVRIDPTLEIDGITAEMMTNAPREDLQRLLAAALLRLRTAEEVAANLASNQHTQSHTERNNRDPDGLCALLGIHPDILDTYSAPDAASRAALQIILNGAARSQAKILHPDLGDTSQQLAKINNARDRLLDPAFLKSYLRRSQ